MDAVSIDTTRHIHLEDLSGFIEIILLVGYFTALYQVYQQDISVSSLAHALSLAFLTATCGHYIEQHLLDKHVLHWLLLERFPQLWSSVGCALLSTVVTVVHFWRCAPSEFDCFLASLSDPLWSSKPQHWVCRRRRLRYYAPVWAGSAVFVFLVIGFRVNLVLGGSVLTPNGGSHFTQIIKSPPAVAGIYVASCCSVMLYALLIEAEGRRLVLSVAGLDEGKLAIFNKKNAARSVLSQESVGSGYGDKPNGVLQQGSYNSFTPEPFELPPPPTLTTNNFSQSWEPQKGNSSSHSAGIQYAIGKTPTPTHRLSSSLPIERIFNSPKKNNDSTKLYPSRPQQLHSDDNFTVNKRRNSLPPTPTAKDRRQPISLKINVSNTGSYLRRPSFQRGPGDVSHLISSESSRSDSFSSTGSDQYKPASASPPFTRQTSQPDVFSQFMTPRGSFHENTHFFGNNFEKSGNFSTSSEDEEYSAPRFEQSFYSSSLEREHITENKNVAGSVTGPWDAQVENRHAVRRRHLKPSHSSDSIYFSGKEPSFESDETELTNEEDQGSHRSPQPSQGFTGASIMQTFHEVSEKVKEKEKNPWVECFDESTGMIYFYNEMTGDSSWENPAFTSIYEKED